MIGTSENAALALNGHLPRIGEGSTRIAYLVDGVVYKVEGTVDYAVGSNLSEHDNSARLQEMETFPFVPVSTYLHSNGVLAMPYVDGTLIGECMTEYEIECDLCALGECVPFEKYQPVIEIVSDAVSYGNVIRKDRILYMVDMAV